MKYITWHTDICLVQSGLLLQLTVKISFLSYWKSDKNTWMAENMISTLQFYYPRQYGPKEPCYNMALKLKIIS
jgi:hypothetical protein